MAFDKEVWQKYYFKNNKEKYREASKKYYDKNKENILKKKKEYNATPNAKALKKVRDKTYHAGNRDRINAYRREWRAKRKEKDPDYWKKEVGSPASIKRARLKYKGKPGMLATLSKRARLYHNENKKKELSRCKSYDSLARKPTHLSVG